MPQIVTTYKCNFTCTHCLFSCGPRRKEMISRENFDAFIKVVENDGSGYVNLCGGEIFLHPDWERHVQILTWTCATLRIVTNGSLFFTPKGNPTKVLRRFMELLRDRGGACEVIVLISNDRYHWAEYVARNLYPLEKVIRRFQDFMEENFVEITYEKDRRNNYTNSIMALGRAKVTQVYDYEGTCMVEKEYYDPNMGPDGNYYACCNMKKIVGRYYSSQRDCENNLHGFRTPPSCMRCKNTVLIKE